MHMIHQYTQGYPRKIAMLCHDALEDIVMNERERVDAEVLANLITQQEVRV